MSPDKSEQLLGRIAVHLKMITMDQLAEATRAQGQRAGVPFGAILIEQGYIQPAQLEELLRYQREYLARKQGAGSAAGEAAKGSTAPQRVVGAPPPGAAPGGVPRPPAPSPAPKASAPARPAARGATAKSAKAAAGAAAPSPAAPSVPSAVAAAAAPSAASAAAPAATAARERLDGLLRKAAGRGASDLHIHSGAPVKMRLNGEFADETPSPLPAAEARDMLVSCMTLEQRAQFETRGEIDFAYTIPGAGRFRVNVYQQHRGCDGIFRVIPPAPPTLGSLSLPLSLARVVNFHQGMVLLTGPAGCGKSSTMAALVDILNEERRDHILTIEDPIEHVHASKRCIVNQRQVTHHTESFARALRAALREDPDIIVIGELRDRETISLALTAAETGHLVLGTLHTHSAIRTINRIVGSFPPEQQGQIRTMISESLKAIVSQRLVRTADGKRRVPALEILMCNRAVGNLIRESKTFQILSILQTGAPQGMCLMDNSLAALLKAGTVTRDEAVRYAEDPKRLAA